MERACRHFQMGFFEMYEHMDHPSEYFNMRNSSEDLQTDQSRSFSGSKFPHMDGEIQSDYKSQEVFVGLNSHTTSLLPRRSLHKQTFRVHRKLVRNSTTSVYSAEHGDDSFRNHPSAPPVRYSSHFQQFKHRSLHDQLQESQPKKQFGCTHANTCRNTKYTRRQSKSISDCIDAASRGISLRNFPIAPSPYITQLKHNEMTSRYIANLGTKTKNLPEGRKSSCGFKGGCASFIQSIGGEVKSSQGLNVLSDDSSQTEDCSTSSSFSSPESQHHLITSSSKPASFLNYRNRNTIQNQLPLTVNTSTADSTEKNQMQSRLANESNSCFERTASSNVPPQRDDSELPRCIATSEMIEVVDITPEKITEDSYDELETTCHSFMEEEKTESESKRCFERTTSSNVPAQRDDPELPRCIATSEMIEVVDITPEKITKDSYDELETICHSFMEEEKTESESKRCFERTASSNVPTQMDDPELPRCIATSEMIEVVDITPEKITEDSYDELETTCHSFMEEEKTESESKRCFERTASSNVPAQRDDPELPRCIATSEMIDVVDITPEKIIKDSYDELEATCHSFMEEEKTEGLKLDVSFSFMEKGGYHPIALPLGCHIFDDESDGSENEEKSTSVLEKRMAKMGRDEFHLNVDTSSSFMPWIVIPLDDISEVRYDCVNFFNPEDPRLRKYQKSLELNSLNVELPHLFCDPYNQEIKMESELDQMESEVQTADCTFKGEIMDTNKESTSVVLESTQECVDDVLKSFDLSFTDSLLQMNADSLEFHDKILDTISPETADADTAEMGLPQYQSSEVMQTCARDDFQCFQQNEISTASDGIALQESTAISENATLESMEAFEDLPSKNDASKFNDQIDISSSGNEQSKDVETSSVDAKTDSETHQQRCEALANDKNAMPNSDDSSNDTQTVKLPLKTIQLLKETAAFLKDENLSTRRIRRLRRVSTSLRVADFALPNFLEDLYVESESSNYAERLRDISFNGDLCESDKSTSDKEILNKNGLSNDTENSRVVPRRSKRTTKTSGEDANLYSSESCHLKNTDKKITRASQRNTQKGSDNQQSGHESPKAKYRKLDDDQKPQNNLFVLKYEGRKYKCVNGILKPAICEDSTNLGHCTVQDRQDHSLNSSDNNQNASKTGYNVKMRNGVVKRKLTNEKSDCKKSRSRQSPKVVVHNCFQQIAVSQTKCSETVTTRSTVGIIQKTTKVRKKLFPVIIEENQSARKGTSQLKTKGAKSVEKKQSVGKQKQIPTKSIQKKTVVEKHTSSIDVKVEKHTSSSDVKVPKFKEEDATCVKDLLTDSKYQNELPVQHHQGVKNARPAFSVKPIIRIHQGLRNTSLKQFKARQYSKGVGVPNIKKDPQRAFPCSHCDKSFKKAAQVEKHIKDDHTCSQCEKIFDSKVAKQRHFYSCHATEVHKCTTCQKEYEYPFHLRKHFESQSHMDLIKNLLREVKRLSKKRLLTRRMPALDYGDPNSAICQKEAPNKCLAMSDKVLEARSNRKSKFMEMESSFFDKNPDLLELVHKINYVDNGQCIVKHFIYKDPELGEIQSYLKDELRSSSSCYEEIEIINEYSITNHCENFLEDANNDFDFSNGSRSSGHRCSSTLVSSGFSEEDLQGWSWPHHTTDPYSCTNQELSLSPVVSGWFSAAVECMEQRNLDDDPTYSSYLGLLNSESGMELPNNAIIPETLNRSVQEIPPKIVESSQELCHFSTEGYAPENSKAGEIVSPFHQNDLQKEQNLCLCTSYKNTLSIQEKSSLLPFIPNAEEAIFDVSETSSSLQWKSPGQTENETLDVALSLIMLSNTEQDVLPKMDELPKSTGPSRDEMNVKQEYESLCAEILRDVQNYKE